MFPIIVGMNRGFTRLGPFSSKVAKPFCSSSMPPMPVPNTTAMRSRFSSVTSKPDWASASSAATMAYCTKRSKRRASFLVRPCSVPSKSRTSPAMCTSYSLVSKRSMGAMQQPRSMSVSHSASAPTPAGVTAPTPVMTTRWVPSGRRVWMLSFSLIKTFLRPRR